MTPATAPQHPSPSEVPGEVPSEVPTGVTPVPRDGGVPGSLSYGGTPPARPVTRTPPHEAPSEVPSPNSGLYIHPADCEYCHAWPTLPCALHRSSR